MPGDIGHPEKQQKLLEWALALKEHEHSPEHCAVAIILAIETTPGDITQPETQQELLKGRWRSRSANASPSTARSPPRWRARQGVRWIGRAAKTGSGSTLALIAREVALDIAESAYSPDIGSHLPGDANTTADELSRRDDPRAGPWQLPPELQGAAEAKPRREIALITGHWPPVS